MNDFDKKVLGFELQIDILSQYAKSIRAKSILHDIHILKDKPSIQSSLDDMDALFNMHQKLHSLPMSDHYDLFDLLLLMEKGHVLTIHEAFKLYQMMLLLESLIEYNSEFSSISKDTFIFDKYPLHALKSLEILMKKTFNDDGQILDDASEALYSVRKKLSFIDQKYLKSLQQALVQYQSLLTDHIIVTRGDALCLAVSESYKNQIKGLIHDVSQSGLTVYIEPIQSKNIRSDKYFLLEEEKIAILEILKHISKEVSKHLDVIAQNIESMLQLDILEAKVLYSRQFKLEKPIINEEEINLKKAWHLELERPVPVDIHLPNRSLGLFITGPNTGGKTVTLKTLGLCQLMAQAGLFIPAARDSKIMIFNHILADIGDDQSIINNLSTFSAHLKKHIENLKYLTSPSLILIDEIGSGTDPQEGVALAKSILDDYIKKESLVVVTTHYQALKQFAIEKGFELASVAFDKETLAPQYHIQMGMSGQSHAFDIARRLGMESRLLDHALAYYQNDQSQADKLLLELQNKSDYIQQLQHQLNEEKKKLNDLNHAFQFEKKAFEIEKKDSLDKLMIKLQKQYETKLKALEDLMHDITLLDFKTQAKIKGTLNEIKKEEIPIEHKDETFFIGDIVYVKAYEQEGIVKKVLKQGYEVDLGKFIMTFNAQDLTHHNTSKESKKIKKPLSTSQHQKPQSQLIFELDLRGFRYEDVKPALEKAIDQALFSNQKNLRVIHGFGTGAVRNAVYAIIKKHPQIESYRYGAEGEGLNGVTIISFK